MSLFSAKGSKSSDTSLFDAREVQELSEEEKQSLQDMYDRTFIENMINEISYHGAKIAETTGDVLVDLGAPKYQGDFEKREREEVALRDKETAIKQKAGMSDIGWGGKLAGSVFTYGAPLARLGVVGQGASSIPKTAAAWGAADAGISTALGKSGEEVLTDGLLAGGLGGIFGGALHGIGKVSDAGMEAMAESAGGGTPKAEVQKMFEKQAERERQSKLTEEYTGEIKNVDGTTKLDELDTGIDIIRNKLNRLSEEPYRAIIEDDPATFQGMSRDEAYELLNNNRPLADELAKDLETRLFKELDELDYMKYGDDRIVVGAKEDLVEVPPNPEKGLELANFIREERQAIKDTAKGVQDFEISKRQFDFARGKKELTEAYSNYKNNPNETTLMELDYALSKIEPVKEAPANVKAKIIKPLEDDYSVGEVQPSSTDIAYTNAGIGVSEKVDYIPASTKAKMEEQARINKQQHEGFMEEQAIKGDMAEAEIPHAEDIKPREMSQAERDLEQQAYNEYAGIREDTARATRQSDTSTPDIDNVTGEVKSDFQKIKDSFKDIEATKTNFKTGFKKHGVYKTYQKIHSKTRDALNEAARAGKSHKKAMINILEDNGLKVGGEFDKGFTKNILNTDYIAIRGMSKRDAMKFMNDNNEVYTKARKYIEQTAKGLKDKGSMNHPDFTNNGYQIAQRANLDPVRYSKIIDKLVSIRAMDSNAWRFVEANKGTEAFESFLTMSYRLREQSDKLFKDNPHQAIKGYTSEIYDSMYRYELRNSGEFKKLVDTEVGMVQGGLPQRLDSSRIGDVKKFSGDMSGWSDSRKLSYAEANNLGVVLNKYGSPVATRKVASEAQRLQIGKSTNASDVLPLTFENSVRKLNQIDGVIDDIIRTEDNNLFSSTQRDGMVKLTQEELNTLPTQIRSKVAYVNRDFKHMMLGNKQIQMASSDIGKITEQVLKDSVSHFKENVVLKNPASWVNNMGYNFFVNLQEGISVKTTLANMRRGLKEKKLSEEMADNLIKLELAGKSNTAQYRRLKESLESNLYYQMDRQGLAVTVMSNIMDSPIASKRLTDKALKEATRNILGKEMGDKVADIVSNIYISPQSSVGQRAMNMFGSIDAMGRYSLALENMNRGKSLDDSIKKANSIYGDLDMIAPMWSQAIQHYGFIPFSNWYFRMSGGLAKSVLDNKMKAIGVAGALYGLSELTDKRTASMNPLVTLVDTPIDMVEMSPYFNLTNYARNVVSPAVYKKGYRAIDRKDPLSVMLTRDF